MNEKIGKYNTHETVIFYYSQLQVIQTIQAYSLPDRPKNCVAFLSYIITFESHDISYNVDDYSS